MPNGYLLQNATAASIFVFRPSCSKSPSGVLSGFSETHGWYCVSLPVFCDVDGNSRWGPSTSSGSLPALWENAGTGILAVGTTVVDKSQTGCPISYCKLTILKVGVWPIWVGPTHSTLGQSSPYTSSLRHPKMSDF